MISAPFKLDAKGKLSAVKKATAKPARRPRRSQAKTKAKKKSSRVRIAVVSDTHLPRGARTLPEACVERLRSADLILHAGDLVSAAFLEELRAFGPPVEAVYGNMDEPALRETLPKERVVEVGEVRIGMVHIPGPLAGPLRTAGRALSRLRRRDLWPHARARGLPTRRGLDPQSRLADRAAKVAVPFAARADRQWPRSRSSARESRHLTRRTGVR